MHVEVFMKKIRIFAILLAVLLIIAATVVYVSAEEAVTTAAVQAESTPLRDLNGGDLSFTERIPYAVQGIATGMLMIFAVLILLAVIVSLSKYFFAPATPKAKSEEKPTEAVKPAPAPAPVAAPAPVQSADDQLVAVLTAAVAAMIDSSEEYRSEFASGFRVVSFKRVSSNGAWNKN